MVSPDPLQLFFSRLAEWGKEIDFVGITVLVDARSDHRLAAVHARRAVTALSAARAAERMKGARDRLPGQFFQSQLLETLDHFSLRVLRERQNKAEAGLIHMANEFGNQPQEARVGTAGGAVVSWSANE